MSAQVTSRSETERATDERSSLAAIVRAASTVGDYADQEPRRTSWRETAEGVLPSRSRANVRSALGAC
jgi:hypothetical protein